MKHYSYSCFKALLFIAFIASSFNSFSQNQKSGYKLKCTSSNCKSVAGDMVTLTFFVLNVPDAGDLESLATLMRAQDGIKNVKMSSLSAENTALCGISYLKTFKIELVQQVLKKVGIVEVIIDDVPVPIDNFADYLMSKNKEKQKNK